MISFWSRVPSMLITLALGWWVFVYARRLFGRRAALLAVLLYSFEPTLLAHGRVVQTDVPAALLDGGSFNEHSIPYVRTLDHSGVEQVNLISADEVDTAPPATRYVAVGASYLNGAFLLAVPVPQRLKVIAYRQRTPEAVIDNSIYLYRVGE